MPQVPGVDHRWVRLGDNLFHVAEAGSGSPVVLLHGWPQHWYCWRLVIPSLAERHRVLAIDLRGFGWSDIAWTGFEKESMADDVAGVLAELGVERAAVVGHDWGGYLTYLLALRHPDLVERLVALCAPPPWTRRGTVIPSLWRFAYQVVLASPWLGRKLVERRRYVARKIRQWSTDRTNLDDETIALYTRDLKAPTRARATSLMYRTFLFKDLPAAFRGRYRDARLDVPALVLHSEHDSPLVPRFFRDADRNAPAMTVEEIPGAGHFLPEERPALVASRILDHLAVPAGVGAPR